MAESSAKASEVELTLAVAERSFRRASRLPWLRKLASGPAIRQKLVSVYFDTPKFKLRDKGLTLRIRNVGGKRVQTVKANSDGSAAASGREEHEMATASDEPDLKLVKGTALEPMVRPKLKKPRPPQGLRRQADRGKLHRRARRGG